MAHRVGKLATYMNIVRGDAGQRAVKTASGKHCDSGCDSDSDSDCDSNPRKQAEGTGTGRRRRGP